MRNQTGHPVKNGVGTMHWLDDGGEWASKIEWVESKPQIILPLVERDRQYRALLDELPLYETHIEALVKRGYPGNKQALLDGGFRSLKTGFLFDAVTIEQMPVSDLLPGLQWINGRPMLSLQGDGLILPIRNEEGLIQALQCRLDNRGRLRYVWLSSVKFGGGSSGAPAHWACPPFISLSESSMLVVTEGFFKARALAVCGYGGIGLSGITNVTDDVLSGIKRMRNIDQSIGVDIAFDMDVHSKAEGRAAIKRLGEKLIDIGVAPCVWLWDAEHKGFDDLLQAHSLRAMGCVHKLPWEQYLCQFNYKHVPINALDVIGRNLKG